jgi:signal recognition particle GTPase
MGRKKKEEDAAPQEKAPEFTAAEKKAIAEYYEDRRDELEGKFDTASKSGESTRDKAFKELAEQLTAMGVAVRPVKSLKVKLKSMKQRAREKISEEVGILSHSSQLVAELGVFDVVAKFTHHM